MKLDFYQALEALNDERRINLNDVRADALRRKVWVSEWHIPGCVSESFGIHVTKRDAIKDALRMCDHARGAATDLRKYGCTDKVSPDAYVSMAITTIEHRTLGSLF